MIISIDRPKTLMLDLDETLVHACLNKEYYDILLTA